MDDPALVRGVESGGDLLAVEEDFVEAQGRAREPGGERFALDHLEDEVVDGLALDRLLADVVQGADVRMVQRGDALRLAFEPRAELRPSRASGGGP